MEQAYTSSDPSKTSKVLSIDDMTEQQDGAVGRMYGHDETLLIAGLGFGKAIVALTAIQMLIEDNHLKRVLVVAPLRVAQLTWGTEPDKWSHITVGVAVACGTPTERHAAASSTAPVVVTNLENVKWMLEHYGDTFDGVCFDEMTKLKSVSGTNAKALRTWVKKLKWRAGMTGTPVAEAGADLYGQAVLLDLGKALGTRKDAFMRAYFYPTDYHERNWAIQPGAELRLSLALAPLVYFADDAQYKADLPPVKTSLVQLTLPADARTLYNDMAKDSVCTVDGVEVVAETAAVQQGKKFQIAAGGLYDNDGDLIWSSGHKERACIDIVSRQDLPIIIVYQFSFELEWLRAVYPDAPVLGAGGKFTPALQGEWNDGLHPVLIMHPKSAAHGLNLQYATDTMLYLSPVWGADPWAQTIGRIRRRGTPFEEIRRIVLIANGTVDEDIMGRQDEKFASESELMAALA